jgi:methionine-R-sulfoxide reductase
MAMQPLTPEEEAVIVHKHTEAPFTGEYDKLFAPGKYVCKRCGVTLYDATSKFESGCGWPSFDKEVPGAVKRTRDADGIRAEITCTHCGAHLGHVFEGEHFTDTNTRHCVNSISLKFIPDTKTTKS